MCRKEQSKRDQLQANLIQLEVEKLSFGLLAVKSGL